MLQKKMIQIHCHTLDTRKRRKKRKKERKKKRLWKQETALCKDRLLENLPSSGFHKSKQVRIILPVSHTQRSTTKDEVRPEKVFPVARSLCESSRPPLHPHSKPPCPADDAHFPFPFHSPYPLVSGDRWWVTSLCLLEVTLGQTYMGLAVTCSVGLCIQNRLTLWISSECYTKLTVSCFHIKR